MYIKVFRNVVTDEERRVLLAPHRANENPGTTKRPARKFTFLELNNQLHTEARELYLSILDRTLGKTICNHDPMVTDLGGPAILHHDYTGGEFKTNVLIPLELTPSTGKAFTVIFEQQEPGSEYTLYSRTLLTPGRSPRTNDYSKLLNLKDESLPFDQTIYEEHLKHLDPKDLLGLSLAEAVEWSLGDLIAFDCRLIHTGNYASHGLETKAYATSKVAII